MPPALVPHPTKKKLRPSSAAARIQSYSGYYSSLFDDSGRWGRPSTAVGAAGGGGHQRPKTQAGGPRAWARKEPDETEVLKQPQRRQTVANVTGISEEERAVRPHQNVLTLGDSMMAKFVIVTDVMTTEMDTGWPVVTSQQDDVVPSSEEQVAASTIVITAEDGHVISESEGEEEAPPAEELDLRIIRRKGWIEEKINIDTLEALKGAFERADLNRNGTLDRDEFKDLLKTHLGVSGSKEAQIDALFSKIDWSSEGQISWDEFCTYMQLEYAEKEDSYFRAKDVSFNIPAKIEHSPHREPLLRITDAADGSFIACSQTTEQPVNRQKPKWITDFVIMSQFNKFIVGTGDREVQFFELSSFEPYCQLSGLPTVPLKLDYCSTGADECLVLYGDSDGCINILFIQSAGECLRTWKKKPKADGIASVSLDEIQQSNNTRFVRWKVHDDWVQQLKYYHEIRQVVSCSNHANTGLVIGSTLGSTDIGQQLKEIKEHPAAALHAGHAGQHDAHPPTRGEGDRGPQTRMLSKKNDKPRRRLSTDETVFKVYKGVKCFHFAKQRNIIVTGGMDRIVRMWNPYVPGKHTGMLRGHNAPIFYLFVAEDENRVFSVSTDKCIKVWDIQDQNCLLTLRPKGHKIRGDMQVCHYSNVSKSLAVATDQMNCLQLKMRAVMHADIPTTHKEPVHAVVFNSEFNQVITSSEASVVKVWDFETGNAIFEFGEAHGEEAITCLTFDNKKRRLITGGRDGTIRIWNYNNGHCLRTMMKPAKNEEICDLTYVEMNRNRYIIAVGWDKRINIYNDSVEMAANHIHIQHPQPMWTDDENNGHKEDILSVAQCKPNLLATSSYDGEVIVWNLVSGHIFCHLRPPMKDAEAHEKQLAGDLSVNSVVFMEKRAYVKEAATLVASGPDSCIHLWNVFHGGSLYARFPGSQAAGALVTALVLSEDNRTLYSSDSAGFVYVWSMEGYGLKEPEPEPPELLVTWRAHVDSLTSLTLVESQSIIMTSSLDCTVRMWSTDGEYVGTFGQPDAWDVYNRATYLHPEVPYDVLIDPRSLPSHPVIADKQDVQTIIYEDKARSASVSSGTVYTRQVTYNDDATIATQLADRPYQHGKGKRLRHEKLRPIPLNRGGPSDFQMLRCYPLADPPMPKDPRKNVRVEPLEFME